jgi:FkbM family methyltransferase
VITRALGVARSLAMYYGPVWRRRRMVAFYGAFVPRGGLAFDLGAHVGNRIRAFRALGARVVAVEPQPDLLAVLRALYGRDPAVTLAPVAVAAAAGAATLHISTRTPTLSTLDATWTDEVRADPRFAPTAWDARRPVEVTTLDALIATHGEPDFTKIDVEGGELAVLEGLTRPLPALSFEAIPIVAARAIACVARLASLGDYLYRFSPVETLRWTGPWRDADAIVDELAARPAAAGSGDVYAVRRDRVPA